MLRIPVAGMDERGALEVLLPVLLRGRCPTSDTVLVGFDDEDCRVCLRKIFMDR